MAVHHPTTLATPATPAGCHPPDPADGPTPPDHRAGRCPCRPRQTYASAVRALSGRMRSRIWQAYQLLGGSRGRLNDQRRATLSEAVFHIENDLEHRQSDHPTVRTLRAIRHRLYDDLGWNAYQPDRCPDTAHAA